MDSKFNQVIAELVSRYMERGLTLDEAVQMLAVNLKNLLIESGLYEELRARAAADTVPSVMTTGKHYTRNEAIQAIKTALRARGLSYSVRGGRGTAYGWLHIDLMPKVLKGNDQIVKAERQRMHGAFGLPGCGSEISVPSSSAYYREYIDRANGREPSVKGEPYWD